MPYKYLQEIKRVLSSDEVFTAVQLGVGTLQYNPSNGSLLLVAQNALGAPVLVPIATGVSSPGQVVTQTTFTAGAVITAGQFLALDSTTPNRLVPCSFPGQNAVAVARANAALNAPVDALLYGPTTVKAGANFAIGAVLKTNLNAEAIAATALNAAAAAVNGSAVLGYARTAGVTGQNVDILFVGGATMLPTNYQ